MKFRYSSSGLHLFDRSSGTNILLDELSVPEEKYCKAPRQISIALTNACDLKCQHCYAPKKPATLSYDLLTKWLLELDENGSFGIGFGGGEPTLFPRFAELCAFAQKETALAVTFTSHGHWLTNEMLDKLADNVNFIRVSMDGIGHTYESMRGKSFDDFISKLSMLKGVVPFGVNYVINEQTLPDLGAASNLLEDIGATELLFLPEISPLGTVRVQSHSLDIMRQWILDYKGGLRLSISEGNQAGLPVCDALPDEVGLSAYAHIDAMGRLKKNSYCRDGIRINEGIMSALEKFE